MIQFGLGLLFAFIISYAAYKVGSLSPSGAWTAFLEGVIIFGLGGWKWAVLLLAFFISSSILTRLFEKRKASLNEKFEKGGKRDAGQVLANGWVASLCAGCHFFFPGASWPWLAFAGSLAAVNADTWATELGVLSQTLPILITNGKKVERGTSGGITPLGTIAAMGGAILIALLGAFIRNNADFWLVVISCILGGLAGSFVDSYLGATIQTIYHCPHCDKETEKHPLHTCGTKTIKKRGLSWLNNDMVNLFCAIMGATIGILFSL